VFIFPYLIYWMFADR